MQAEELIKLARPQEAMDALVPLIRAKPQDAKLRIFLFQLLAVTGQWERAVGQLETAGQLDAKNLLMAQLCRQAIICEKMRTDVFAGKRSPLIVGEPSDWLGRMLQAAQMSGTGEHRAAGELRAQALEAAPATSGTIEFATAKGTATSADATTRPTSDAAAGSTSTEPFEWIADGDARLGPILELIVDGRYYWAPFDRLKQVEIEQPTDLRDVIWLPAKVTWSTGASTVALIPTRYAGTETNKDGELLLARRTDWAEIDGGGFVGLGHRVLNTDTSEHALMNIRRITLNSTPPPAGTDAEMPVMRPSTKFDVGAVSKMMGGKAGDRTSDKTGDRPGDRMGGPTNG